MHVPIQTEIYVSQWLKMGFGLVIGFFNNLQVVTTINYYTIAALHNLQSLHTNLFKSICTSIQAFIIQEL
jgi:hypothetical protein